MVAEANVTTPPAAASAPPPLPDALADLDHDGRLERVSIRREARQLVVGIVGIPGLSTRRSWTIDGDYVEVGTTRALPGRDGDLWMGVGVALDDKGNQWKHAVYQLEGEQLVVSLSDVPRAFFRPTLHVVDATRVHIRNGPQGGNLADVAQKSTVVVSTVVD